MNSKSLFKILSILLLFTACTPTKKVSKKRYYEIVTQSPSKWTYTDCEDLIKNYTAYNMKGYGKKYSGLSYKEENVFIKATPLNEEVIQAIIKREAIVRRYSEEEYRINLKDYLEAYTNKTVNLSTGDIQLKEGLDGIKWKEVSFIVTFENISDFNEPIELEYAEEGFFLENEFGNFGRAINISGYYLDDEFFVLIDKMKVILTFSLYDDNGKNIFAGTGKDKNYRLVFNGFQAEPIIVEWEFD